MAFNAKSYYWEDYEYTWSNQNENWDGKELWLEIDNFASDQILSLSNEIWNNSTLYWGAILFTEVTIPQETWKEL